MQWSALMVSAFNGQKLRFSDNGRFSVALENKWQFVTTLNLAQPTKKVLPIALSHRFKSRIIRTEATIGGVKATWRRAGYIKQMSSIIPPNEITSRKVPLNTQKIFGLPLVTNTYQLIFTPVAWLPAGMRVRFWEYTGITDDALINELLLIESD